jgi:hypothetical protein
LGPGLPNPPLNFRVHLQRQKHRFVFGARLSSIAGYFDALREHL